VSIIDSRKYLLSFGVDLYL